MSEVINGISLGSQGTQLDQQIQTTPLQQMICETRHYLNDLAMQEWTDEFIINAQHELSGMVKDWKYDYGADDKACSAMLLWMVLKLNPEAKINATMLQPFDHFPC